MTKFLAVAIILGLSRGGMCQNLVRNGGFEEISKCPTEPGQLHLAAYWRAAYGTPDLFNSCNPGYFGIPNNFVGSAYAAEGSGYCGMYLITRVNGNKKKYDYFDNERISQKLAVPLIPNTGYAFSMKIFVADSTKLLYNKVYVIFYRSASGVLGRKKTINSQYKELVFDEKIRDWVSVEGSFVASKRWDSIMIMLPREFLSKGEYRKITRRIRAGFIPSTFYIYIDDIVLQKTPIK